MNPSSYSQIIPLLSVLIFGPLLAAAVAACIRSERLLRWWTLALHARAPRLFSLPLYFRFNTATAAFQFVEQASLDPVAQNQLVGGNRWHQPVAGAADDACHASLRALLLALHPSSGSRNS